MNTMDALSKLENYYLNAEEMERKRLSEEIEYVSKIITTAYVPRFKSAVETLQKIIRIEKIKGKRYDYDLFNRLWVGSYDAASIRDFCGNKFLGWGKFCELCCSGNILFGKGDVFMDYKQGLIIESHSNSLDVLRRNLKNLKNIIHEFSNWYEKVMDYAELCIEADNDKIAPKEGKKPYKVFYVSSVMVNATDSKNAMDMAEEYLKENYTEPFSLISTTKNLE